MACSRCFSAPRHTHRAHDMYDAVRAGQIVKPRLHINWGTQPRGTCEGPPYNSNLYDADAGSCTRTHGVRQHILYVHTTDRSIVAQKRSKRYLLASSALDERTLRHDLHRVRPCSVQARDLVAVREASLWYCAKKRPREPTTEMDEKIVRASGYACVCDRTWTSTSTKARCRRTMQIE